MVILSDNRLLFWGVSKNTGIWFQRYAVSSEN